MANNIVNTEEYYLEKEILAPYTHILQVNPKHLRDRIVGAFNHWLKVPQDKLQDILDFINMIYQAGLIVDDVQDNTLIRRGLPAAHCVYGMPLTINAGIHIAMLALGRVSKIHPKGVEIYQQHFLEVLRGQSTEMYWRDNMICPTEEQCMHMYEQKNGRMFTMPVCLMQLISEENADCFELALRLGLYFQLREDYLNVFRQEELEEFPDPRTQKSQAFSEDITEGKFTIPMIHAMGTPQREQIRNILHQRTTDLQLKKYCIMLLKKSGSYEHTRNVLKKLDYELREMLLDITQNDNTRALYESTLIVEMITGLGGNPILIAVLDDLLATM